MKEKTFSILLLICILCFIAIWLLLTQITLKNEYALKDKDMFTRIYISRQFNYVNGLWLIPSVLFFVIVCIILELPSYEDVYKKIKDDIKKKRGEFNSPR